MYFINLIEFCCIFLEKASSNTMCWHFKKRMYVAIFAEKSLIIPKIYILEGKQKREMTRIFLVRADFACYKIHSLIILWKSYSSLIRLYYASKIEYGLCNNYF